MKDRRCWETSEEAMGVAVLQVDDLVEHRRVMYWRAGLALAANAILLEMDMVPWCQLVVWV